MNRIHGDVLGRRSRRLSAFSGLALGIVLVLITASLALADDLVVDGDGLVPVTSSALNLGSICAGNSASGDALLAIRRTGQGNPLHNVFANGTTATITAGAPSGDATVSTAFTDNSVTVPADWAGSRNNTMTSDTATSQVTVTASGAGAKSASVVYTATGQRASDNTDLTKTATLTINWTVIVCDSTPPEASPTQSPAANTAGWNNTDVTVNWDWSDNTGGSGTNTSACTMSSTSTGEGEITLNATCKDNANNQGSASYTVKVDKTAPTINGSAWPAPNGNGWYKADVAVTFTCDDGLSGSGIDSCGPDATLSSEGAGQSVTGTAVDNAGNSAWTEVGPLNIDKTNPSVTASAAPPANGHGWNNSAVTISFNGEDLGGSGVDACAAPVVVSTEGAGQTGTGECTDLAGNTGSASATVNIDLTAPSVSLVGGPVDGASYPWAYVPAEPTCTASDALSDIDGTCVVSGYSTAVGTHTVTATAKDKAGNSASTSATYTVAAWSAYGFYRPVDMGFLNTVKGGATVPLKFQVLAAYTEMTDTWVVKSMQAVMLPSCNSSESTAPVEELSPAGSALLRYDATAGHFIFNWKTPKNPGKCYKVTLTLQDGTQISTNFRLS